MTCYCGKKGRCRHVGPAVEPEQPKRAVQQPVQTPVTPETAQIVAARSSLNVNLFEWTDRRELLCVVCSKVIHNGPDMAYLRATHGRWHVHRNEAVEDNRGLEAGATRFYVNYQSR